MTLELNIFSNQNPVSAPDNLDTVMAAGEGPLISSLFAGDPVLAEVAFGRRLLNPDTLEDSTNLNSYGPHILRIKLALKVIHNISPDSTSLNESFRYDSKMQTFVVQFKSQFSDMDNNALIDGYVLKKMDDVLNAIFFYDVNTGRRLHDARSAVYVGAYTVCLNQQQLKEWPDPAAGPVRIGGVAESVPAGQAVFMIQVLDNKDWFWIETVTGVHGYLPKSSLWLDSPMPDPASLLVTIPANNTQSFKKIAVDHLKKDPGQYLLETDLTDEEWRFYALVALRMNNANGEVDQFYFRLNLQTGLYKKSATKSPAGIYLINPIRWEPYKHIYGEPGSEFAFDGQTTVYQKSYQYYYTHIQNHDVAALIKLKAGQKIWLPGIAAVKSLYAQLQLGKTAFNTPTYVDQLKQKAQLFFDQFRPIINERWPVGVGVRMDASLGATFGIPVSVDRRFYFSIWRDTEYTLKIIKRGSVAVGLDTGAGASVFLGLGGDRGKAFGEDNNFFGVYATAGWQVGAGIEMVVQQEMRFDIRHDHALASVFLLLMDQATSAALNIPNAMIMGPALMGKLFLTVLQFNGLDPNDYTTKLKVEAVRYVRGRGDASAGFGYASKPKYKAYWENDNSKHDVRKGLVLRDPFSLLTKLSLQLGVGASVQMATGIEIKHLGIEYDTLTGLPLPKKTTLELYLDAEAQISGTINIPILSTIYPSVLKGDIGGGGRVIFEYTYSHAEFGDDPTLKEGFHFKKLALYTKEGSTDIYQSPASETEFQLAASVQMKSTSPAVPGAFSFTIPFLNGAASLKLDQVYFRKILGFDKLLSLALSSRGRTATGNFFSREKDLNILIKHTVPGNLLPKDGSAKALKESLKQIRKASHFGFNLIALIDLEYKPPMSLLKELILNFYNDLNSQPGFSLLDIPVKILEMFKNPETIGKYKPMIRRALLKSEVPNLQFHGELGLSLGAGFYIADLGKLRLRMTATGNVLYHFDLKQALPAYLEEHFNLKITDLIDALFLDKPSPQEEILISQPSNAGNEVLHE